MNRMIGKRVLTFLIVAGMMMVQGTDIVRSASVEESNGEMETTEEQETEPHNAKCEKWAERWENRCNKVRFHATFPPFTNQN